MDVTKKLIAGSPGKHGAALICVRYRAGRKTSRRYKTVELIVEEYGPPRRSAASSEKRQTLNAGNPGDVLVRIGYAETDLRSRIKAAGGRWLNGQKVWKLACPHAVRLALLDRIVTGR